MTLRPARAEDAADVARIWAAGWRDGHLGNVPDELVAARTPESFAERAAAGVGARVGDMSRSGVDVPTVGGCGQPRKLSDPGASLGPTQRVGEVSGRRRTKTTKANTIVAEVDGVVAGFVMVVADEVEQVYVDGAYRGGGVAGLLLSEAERLVASAGHPAAWLAVVPGNARARRFYERCGWVDEGGFEYEATGDIRVPCRRYEKRL